MTFICSQDIYNESLEVVAKTKIEPTALRLNPVYIKIYLIYMNFIIHGIIPFITLILMNINIYRKVCLYLFYYLLNFHQN